ncbi:T9SS type A sorting domain-containing protein, partial [Flavobacteriales bacterium]|nr:T9SS type A sorting domain-containing protein [Flavobacteriales bacterium]
WELIPPINCPSSSSLFTSNITHNSADLNWISGYGGNTLSWEVEYGPAGFTPGTGISVSTILNIASIAGLTEETSYDFYVIDDCGGVDVSTHAGPYSFTTTCNNNPITAPLLETFGGLLQSPPLICWTQDKSDDFDWGFESFTTPSSSTGPSDDMTGGGDYMYIETSYRDWMDSAVMYSSSIDLSALSRPQLRFFSHMYGATIGSLSVAISDDGGANYTTIFSRYGEDWGNYWIEKVVDIHSYTGNVIFKIIGVRGDGHTGDIAIDNFEVRQDPNWGCIDAAACNYNPYAWNDDGSCEGTPGCMDISALNYDLTADCDDGSCILIISGCTDATACNYNASATSEDGSCIYSIDLDACATCSGATDGTGTIVDNDDDDDGVCNIDEIVGCTYSQACNYDPLATDEDNSCVFVVSSNCETCVNGAVVLTDTDGDGVSDCDEIVGCTYSQACNYNPLATDSDGSCVFVVTICETCNTSGGVDANDADLDGICDADEVAGCTDPAAFNYNIDATDEDGSCVAVIMGCMDANYTEYDVNANTSDASCLTLIVMGCMDSTAVNYNSSATVDDNSCAYTCIAKPTGLNAYEITDTRFRLGWDNMNTTGCMVLKYHVRYRETGTTTWTTRGAGHGNGLCNFGLNNIEKLMIGFQPSTTYDIRLRVQYCGSTQWSAWTSTLQVTMADPCPDLTNVSVQTFNGQQNKAKFTWGSTGVYSFARLYTRLNTDSANGNPYPWTIQGGFGIDYPAFHKNIFNFTPGATYRVQAKSFCSYTMTSYQGSLTTPVIWTQPSSVRLEGSTAIDNLTIYPNPSRDIFNITFTSEYIQTLEVRIINVVGEVVYTEDLEEFVGEYNKQINLATYPKGAYFLEITTNNGVINKKLMLQ